MREIKIVEYNDANLFQSRKDIANLWVGLLIYGQHHCIVKTVMPEESLPQGIEGEVISVHTLIMYRSSYKANFFSLESYLCSST